MIGSETRSRNAVGEKTGTQEMERREEAQVFEQLTDYELMTFYRWLQSEYNIMFPAGTAKQIRNFFLVNLKYKRQRSALAFVFLRMFGTQPPDVGKQILNVLPEFKKKLAESPYTGVDEHNLRTWHETWNEYVGTVVISRHALVRFNQRVFRKRGSFSAVVSEKLLQTFNESFARAKPVEIDPIEKRKYPIDNGFKIAQYLLDTVINIRFIICEAKRRKVLTIVTVERPR
ncbi:MAG: hypothetical protein HYT27_02455 [Parcubacteria group bacterium]|nr:hypothetical protein [Parcubacteria group bacterium]